MIFSFTSQSSSNIEIYISIPKVNEISTPVTVLLSVILNSFIKMIPITLENTKLLSKNIFSFLFLTNEDICIPKGIL